MARCRDAVLTPESGLRSPTELSGLQSSLMLTFLGVSHMSNPTALLPFTSDFEGSPSLFATTDTHPPEARASTTAASAHVLHNEAPS